MWVQFRFADDVLHSLSVLHSVSNWCELQVGAPFKCTHTHTRTQQSLAMHEHKEHTAQYARAAINDMVCMCIEYVRVCCLAMCERNSLGDDVVVAAANASTLPITHRRFVCACVYVVRRGGVPCVGVRVLRFLLLFLAQCGQYTF